MYGTPEDGDHMLTQIERQPRAHGAVTAAVFRPKAAERVGSAVARGRIALPLISFPELHSIDCIDQKRPASPAFSLKRLNSFEIP